jgi:salicylate hydroxylase
LQHNGDVGAALRGFAATRFARVSRLQLAARRQGRIYHMAGPLRLARNLMIGGLTHQAFLERLAWIYDWKP